MTRRWVIIPPPPDPVIQGQLKAIEDQLLAQAAREWAEWRDWPEGERRPRRPNHDLLWKRIRLLRFTRRFGWDYANRFDRDWLLTELERRAGPRPIPSRHLPEPERRSA